MTRRADEPPRLRGRWWRSAVKVTGGLAVLTLALAGCGGTSAPSSSDTIPTATSGDPLAPRKLEPRQKMVVGITSLAESYAPLLLAKEMGEFEAENLDVEIQTVPANEALLLAAQGRTDVTTSAFTAGTLNLIASGSPLRWVFPLAGQPDGSKQGYWVNNQVVGGGAAPVGSDFVGPKILTSSGDGSSSAYFLWKYIQALPGGAAIQPKDLTIERFDLAAMGQALESGAAGVAQMLTPFYLTLDGTSCCTYLKGSYPAHAQSGFLFGPSMDDRKDVGAAFVRALGRTIRTHLQGDYHSDPAVLSALARVLDQDEATLKALQPPAFDPDFRPFAAENLRAQEFFRARGLLKYPTDLTADQVYDTGYLAAIGANGPA